MIAMANTFGARLILARNEKGLSQFTLAERADMAPTQLSRYETDKVRPRLRIVNTLAAALSFDPDWLLNGDDDADLELADTAPATQCKLRIPTEMHGRLVQLASAANRSLNAEIVRRLAQTLGQAPGPDPGPGLRGRAARGAAGAGRDGRLPAGAARHGTGAG